MWYFAGGGYIVSWCVGHLVELSGPEEYDGRYSKWGYADLPIIPEEWKYRVSSGTKKQFEILKKLMARNDVDSICNCCDAGREDELIFRLVYNKCGCKSRWNDSGSLPWRTAPLRNALIISGPELNMILFMRQPFVGSVQIGSLASTLPGFFHAFTGAR